MIEWLTRNAWDWRHGFFVPRENQTKNFEEDVNDAAVMSWRGFKYLPLRREAPMVVTHGWLHRQPCKKQPSHSCDTVRHLGALPQFTR